MLGLTVVPTLDIGHKRMTPNSAREVVSVFGRHWARGFLLRNDAVIRANMMFGDSLSWSPLPIRPKLPQVQHLSYLRRPYPRISELDAH